MGIAIVIKWLLNTKEQANTLIEQYKKYDTNNHKLLYNAAHIHYYWLKDAVRAEQYLEAYLRTRPKNKKEMPQEVDSDGTVIIGRQPV